MAVTERMMREYILSEATVKRMAEAVDALEDQLHVLGSLEVMPIRLQDLGAAIELVKEELKKVHLRGR